MPPDRNLVFLLFSFLSSAGVVAHPVAQVIGDQAIVDILDLSKVAWTCWGCTNTSNGLGLRMVKDSDPVAGTGNG